MISTSRPLELLHLDLVGPSRTMSIGRNYYALVIMEDYCRFTWSLFLPFKTFCKLAKMIQNEKDLKTIRFLGSFLEGHPSHNYFMPSMLN